MRGREAAASSSEPTTARAASCLFPSGPLLSASFPVDFPVKGPGPPSVASGRPAPPLPASPLRAPTCLPQCATRDTARSPC